MESNRPEISVRAAGQRIASVDVLFYIHQILGMGGFHKAMVRGRAFESEFDAWLETLGQTVTVHSAGAIVWKGWIDTVICRNEFARQAGPLSAMVNRVKLRYLEVDTTAVPPLQGRFAETEEVDGDVLKYGYWPAEVQSGALSSTVAEQCRDAWASRGQEVAGALEITGEQLEQPEVELQCLGYWHRLNYHYDHRSVTAGGTVNLSDKIEDVLDADPNGLFSERSISVNTTQVQEYEDGQATAWEVIKELCSLGPGDRWFGCYEHGAVYGEPLWSARQLGGPQTYPHVRPGMVVSYRGQEKRVAQVEYHWPYYLRVDSGLNMRGSDELAAWGLTGLGG